MNKTKSKQRLKLSWIKSICNCHWKKNSKQLRTVQDSVYCAEQIMCSNAIKTDSVAFRCFCTHQTFFFFSMIAFSFSYQLSKTWKIVHTKCNFWPPNQWTNAYGIFQEIQLKKKKKQRWKTHKTTWNSQTVQCRCKELEISNN